MNFVCAGKLAIKQPTTRRKMEIDYEAIRNCLEKDSRLVQLPAKGQAVFVGDTHGDIEATREVLDLFFKPGYTLVFLGDYVDRGEASRENISLLLEKKLEAPDRLFLLMGNHEGYAFEDFYPAEFWNSLSEEEIDLWSSVCGMLPYVAVSENGLIALHGVPPTITGPAGLAAIEDIALGSVAWRTLVWGDFTVRPEKIAFSPWGRPTYGRDYFEFVMSEFGKSVLIRAHQQDIPETVFDRRCLTIMTSREVKAARRIAIADLEQSEIRSVEEMVVTSLGLRG